MKTLLGAIGGMVLGGGIGWFLPRLFVSQPHEFEALAQFAFQAVLCGTFLLL